MSGNGYNAPYYSVPNTENAYPLQYPPPQRPPPAPLQRSVNPSGGEYVPPSTSTTPNYQSQFSTPLVSTATAVGAETESPKPWPGTFQPDAKIEPGAVHDFTPNTNTNANEQPLHAASVHGRHDDPNRWSFDSAYARPPTLKRFTKPWFKWHWRLQVSRRRLPRLLYLMSGVLLMVGWLSITLSFTKNLKSNEAKNAAGMLINANAPPAPGNESNIFIFMSGQLNRFDTGLRTLNVDWTMFGAKGPLDYNDLTATQISIDSWGREPFALFRDTVARPDKGTNITDYQPFRILNPNTKPVGFLGVTEFDTINTDIGLGQRSSNPWMSPEFGYPFDVFQGTLTWVAASNETITQTGRPGSAVFGMRGAILTDSLLNLKVRSNVTATCFIETDAGCELIIQFWVERTGLVKFCVFAVFLVNWIVTIAIFLVTGEALLLNRTNILSGTDILAICFSALFALPSVRSLLPGVPGYGCLLDLLGILPNVIIVALCTTFFANSRLRMRVHQQEERESKRDD